MSQDRLRPDLRSKKRRSKAGDREQDARVKIIKRGKIFGIEGKNGRLLPQKQPIETNLFRPSVGSIVCDPNLFSFNQFYIRHHMRSYRLPSRVSSRALDSHRPGHCARQAEKRFQLPPERRLASLYLHSVLAVRVIQLVYFNSTLSASVGVSLA